MTELFLQPEAWMSLLTLTIMEIVLGVDNVIFISIVTSKLPETQQSKARMMGIFMALFFRIILLFFISYIVYQLKDDLFTVFEQGISWRDIILLAGGLFLIYKSSHEIFQKFEVDPEKVGSKVSKGFWAVVFEVLVIDIVFSFDSIITAVGLAQHLPIMIIAVVISMFIMMWSAKWISDFINKHPSMKMLALAFLLMIGMLLTVEAFDYNIPKGYVYFAMFFAIFVEVIDISAKKRSAKTVKLKEKYKE